jgi:hypothetical protein
LWQLTQVEDSLGAPVFPEFAAVALPPDEEVNRI